MTSKVTIIIPCYNAAMWVEKSILSALNQKYKNLEVIFVDNESIDGSLAIAKRIQKAYPQLIISTAPNLYRYSWEEPVTEGLKLSTGDYITILGADDFLSDTYISNCMQYIEMPEAKVLVFQSPIRGIRGKDEIPIGEIGHFYTSLTQFKELLFRTCPVTTPTVVYSRELYDRGLLKWDSQYLGAADYDLYFSLVNSGVFIFPSKQWLGYHYRWHEDQATWGMHREEASYDELIRKKWYSHWNPQRDED